VDSEKEEGPDGGASFQQRIAISGPVATDFDLGMTLTGDHFGKHQEKIFSCWNMVNPPWMFFRRFRVACPSPTDCVIYLFILEPNGLR